jgi:hypothetical protein
LTRSNKHDELFGFSASFPIATIDVDEEDQGTLSVESNEVDMIVKVAEQYEFINFKI